jgi:hypothetical protein
MNGIDIIIGILVFKNMNVYYILHAKKQNCAKKFSVLTYNVYFCYVFSSYKKIFR